MLSKAGFVPRLLRAQHPPGRGEHMSHRPHIPVGTGTANAQMLAEFGKIRLLLTPRPAHRHPEMCSLSSEAGVLIHSHSQIQLSSQHLWGAQWSLFMDTETIPITGSVAIVISAELPTRPQAGRVSWPGARNGCNSSTQQPSHVACMIPQPCHELWGRLASTTWLQAGLQCWRCPSTPTPLQGTHALCVLLFCFQRGQLAGWARGDPDTQRGLGGGGFCVFDGPLSRRTPC